MAKAPPAYEAMLERVPCNLCGADDCEEIYPARYELARPENIVEAFRSSGDEILIDPLVRCRRCGLYYLNPRLRQDVIIEGYSGGSDETFVSQAPAREKTFNRALKRIEKVNGGVGRVLDVGAAGGSFLGVAKRRGWEVAGCEPNRWLCEWGRTTYGVSLQPGTLFDMDLADESFDVVTLWDVLEHTPDPKAVLLECRRVLKPDGLLVVNYPAIDSLAAKLMGRKWVFLLSVHLYYFTLPTVRQMLTAAGFETIKHKRHWQTLQLGYIFFRMEQYLPAAAKFGGKILKALRLSHVEAPYWMGQVLVLARRKNKPAAEATR